MRKCISYSCNLTKLLNSWLQVLHNYPPENTGWPHFLSFKRAHVSTCRKSKQQNTLVQYIFCSFRTHYTRHRSWYYNRICSSVALIAAWESWICVEMAVQRAEASGKRSVLGARGSLCVHTFWTERSRSGERPSWQLVCAPCLLHPLHRGAGNTRWGGAGRHGRGSRLRRRNAPHEPGRISPCPSVWYYEKDEHNRKRTVQRSCETHRNHILNVWNQR